MVEEAQRLIKTIKQMEASLDEEKANGQFELDENDLRVSYPLNRCLNFLKEKYNTISKLHRERFEQVRSQSPAIHIGKTILSNTLQSLRKRSNLTPRISSRPLSLLSFLQPHLVHLFPPHSIYPPPTSLH